MLLVKSDPEFSNYAALVLSSFFVGNEVKKNYSCVDSVGQLDFHCSTYYGHSVGVKEITFSHFFSTFYSRVNKINT